MQKKIQDYLPYYIGQQVQTVTGTFTLLGVLGEYASIVNKQYGAKEYLCKILAPLLRPLTDLKDEDFYSFFQPDPEKYILIKARINQMWCATLYEKKEYDERIEEELPVDSQTLIYDMEEADYVNVWSCDIYGNLAYGTGEEMRFFVEVPALSSWINHLRKRGIDCDGLIDAKLAIDKTKL